MKRSREFLRVARRPVVALSLATAAAVAACAVNPATGERQLMLVSQSQEIAMGREADPQITASYGLVENEALQSYVSDVGMRMARASERPDLPWSFKVVDDPLVNAFALPGGYIYVTRGILAHFDSEAEMAGVLGHEIGHVTARHSASQMSRQQLQQVGLVAGMIFSETVREYGQLGAAALQLLNLRYSRGDESQSDRLGLRYMTGLGYDPDAMIGVFDMLASVGGSGDERVPEWQLSHPYPENRAAEMRAIIERDGLPRTGTEDRDEYLDMIDGIVWGDNPRDGYFQGTRFLHPDMAFELTFPSGWTTANQRTVVAGVSPAEDAILALGIASDVTDPVAGLRAFLGQSGVSGGPVREDDESGIRRARAPFEATTDDGTLAGEVAFLRHGQTTFRLMGYAARANWSRHQSAVGSAITSFDVVRDRTVLEVQPLRLDIVTLGEATSLSSWHGRNTPPIDLAALARLNRVDPGEVLSRGTRIKTVVGRPVG